ncbi:tetratricopeptide repeat protein [Haliangium sp.]|uniref:tetratricopeptide repeat protein n=1 Tax=Haliangium sp. TaxID=2663208 RepID=UPI003D09F128
MTRSMMKNTPTYRPRRGLPALRLLAVAAAVLMAAACGSKSKGPVGPGQNNDDGLPGVSQRPERNISTDTRSDYKEALAFFQSQEEAGWNSERCESAAEKFEEVASEHEKLVEAPYMAGLAYDRCGMSDKATRWYERALEVDGKHARSLSNLGTLYFAAGEVDKARKNWEQALEIDSKIVAAHSNLAWLLLQELRKTSDRATWAKLEEEAAKHLSSALAVNSEIVEVYVLYALLYLEGSERNRNRLDLAKLLLDEGAKRNDAYPPLHNARGLLQMRRGNLGEALANFQQAVALDDDFTEARMNVGNITLGFRKYDEAEVQFTKVLAMESKSYDAHLGLGIAQRGLGKLDEAEASYERAIELDDQRGDAYFNLGVLYKDFRANKAEDLEGSKKAYQTALDHFRKYLSSSSVDAASKEEAENNIADCTKIIKQIDEVIQANAAAAAG